MEDPQNIKSEILYDSVIPLLGIYTKEIKTLTQKDTCTFISIPPWKGTLGVFHLLTIINNAAMDIKVQVSF